MCEAQIILVQVDRVVICDLERGLRLDICQKLDISPAIVGSLYRIRELPIICITYFCHILYLHQCKIVVEMAGDSQFTTGDGQSSVFIYFVAIQWIDK